MTYALFKLFGVPVLWQHFKFVLPGVEIEIAKECSGIRSSLALFITSILAGYVFLQSNWRRVLFSLFTVPVVIFKNAVRIVTISCLGVYVDPVFFTVSSTAMEACHFPWFLWRSWCRYCSRCKGGRPHPREWTVENPEPGLFRAPYSRRPRPSESQSGSNPASRLPQLFAVASDPHGDGTVAWA